MAVGSFDVGLGWLIEAICLKWGGGNTLEQKWIVSKILIEVSSRCGCIDFFVFVGDLCLCNSVVEAEANLLVAYK